MKILILTNHFQRSDGVAQSLLSLCNYLSTNEEFNITVLPLYEIKQDFAKDLSNMLRLSDYETNNKASIRQVTTQK